MNKLIRLWGHLLMAVFSSVGLVYCIVMLWMFRSLNENLTASSYSKVDVVDSVYMTTRLVETSFAFDFGAMEEEPYLEISTVSNFNIMLFEIHQDTWPTVIGVAKQGDTISAEYAAWNDILIGLKLNDLVVLSLDDCLVPRSYFIWCWSGVAVSVLLILTFLYSWFRLGIRELYQHFKIK